MDSTLLQVLQTMLLIWHVCLGNVGHDQAKYRKSFKKSCVRQVRDMVDKS